GPVSRESIAGGGYLGSDNPLEGIEHLEGVTGGTRLPLDATGTASLARLVKESAAYYEAELEPDRGDAYGRSRSFAVRSVRRDVADGRVAGRWFAKDAAERPLLGAIAAPAGAYTLRVAALDASGRAGIAEDAVNAQLVSVGPLSLGGLLLGVSRPEGVKLQL